MSAASTSASGLDEHGSRDEVLSSKDYLADESDIGRSDDTARLFSSDGVVENGVEGPKRIIDHAIGTLIEILLDTLDARRSNEIARTKYQEVAVYESSKVGAASRAVLEKRRSAARNAQKREQEKKDAMKKAVASFLQKFRPATDEEVNRVEMAVDTSVSAIAEKAVQTDPLPEEVTMLAADTTVSHGTDMKDVAEARRRDKERSAQNLIRAVVNQTIGEVKHALPAVIAEQYKIHEAASQERQRAHPNDVMPLLTLQNNVQHYMQTVQRLERQVQMVDQALAYLNEESKLLQEAFKRRQSVDKDLYEVIQNHSANIGRHEETLFRFVEIMNTIPQPSQYFGSIPVPGIVDELQRASGAATAAAAAATTTTAVAAAPAIVPQMGEVARPASESTARP